MNPIPQSDYFQLLFKFSVLLRDHTPCHSGHAVLCWLGLRGSRGKKEGGGGVLEETVLQNLTTYEKIHTPHSQSQSSLHCNRGFHLEPRSSACFYINTRYYMLFLSMFSISPDSAHSQPFYKGLNPTWFQLTDEGQLVGDLAVPDIQVLKWSIPTRGRIYLVGAQLCVHAESVCLKSLLILLKDPASTSSDRTSSHNTHLTFLKFKKMMFQKYTAMHLFTSWGKCCQP